LGSTRELQWPGRFKPTMAPPVCGPRIGHAHARPLAAAVARCVGQLPTPSLSSSYKSPDGRRFFLPPPFLSLPPPTEVSHPDRSPLASHRVELPLVDSSCLTYLRDDPLPLPQVLSLESSSFTLLEENVIHRCSEPEGPSTASNPHRCGPPTNSPRWPHR
jgi:hypothetical protein